MNHDSVLIEDLTVECVVGLYDWEQRLPRKLVLNLELGVDAGVAAASDAMEDGVNYAAVCEQVIDVCRSTHYRLLETLAEHIARDLLDRWPLIQSVRLTIRKPGAVTVARNVGVRILRQRDGGPLNQ